MYSGWGADYFAESCSTGSLDVRFAMSQEARRFDEMMEMAVRPSDNADVNRYLLHPLGAFAASPGKRIRPVLCALGCALVGGDPEAARGVGAALESFHAAALIHDDIEDGALVRRGAAAYHVREGIPLAVNAGDYGLAMAFSLVFDDAGMSEDVRLRVLLELTEMAKRTIEGQAVDIGWSRDGRLDITVDDYLFMAGEKSACYSCAAPLALGAIIGGGSDAQVEALRDAGMKAGIAFQICDDLINLQGSLDQTGKDTLTDIEEGKRTILVAHALAHSPRAEKLAHLLSLEVRGPAEVGEIIAILEEAGSVRFAEDAMAALCEQSQRIVERSFEPSCARQALLEIIALLARRAS